MHDRQEASRTWAFGPTVSSGSTAACSVDDWVSRSRRQPEQDRRHVQSSLRHRRRIGERLAAEGEICWGGMQSWRKMVDLLERVGHPERLGFQADMAHTLLYLLGYNAPEDAILPEDFDWNDAEKNDAALKN